MKILKIENSLGKYLAEDGSNWECMTKITRNDLLNLTEIILANEVTLDSYTEGLINHKANEIIYEIVYKKLSQLSDDKVRLLDEINGLYKDAFEKYSN